MIGLRQGLRPDACARCRQAGCSTIAKSAAKSPPRPATPAIGDLLTPASASATPRAAARPAAPTQGSAPNAAITPGDKSCITPARIDCRRSAEARAGAAGEWLAAATPAPAARPAECAHCGAPGNNRARRCASSHFGSGHRSCGVGTSRAAPRAARRPHRQRHKLHRKPHHRRQSRASRSSKPSVPVIRCRRFQIASPRALALAPIDTNNMQSH